MTTKTIKDVDEKAWLEFKSIATRNKAKMGKMFEEMVDHYKDKNENFWDNILKGPALLSEKEAAAMLKSVKKIREEYGFRNLQ